MEEEIIFVLKREGDRLLLPTWERLDGLVNEHIPDRPFLMCRMISYNSETGEMRLSIMPNHVSEKIYQISVSSYSAYLLSLNIKKLSITVEPEKVYSFSKPISNENTRFLSNPTLQILDANRSSTTSFNSSDKQTLTLTIDKKVKDMQFDDGVVTFSHKVNSEFKKVEFRIENSFIKKEHDSIKNYFVHALGTKTFAIDLTITTVNGYIVEKAATSQHISNINDGLFEIVEEHYINDSFTNIPEEDVYDAAIWAEKKASEIGSEKLKDTEYLLNKLITESKTKHYYHLRYLSAKHLSHLFNLHLTGKPLSFIFLLPNGNDFCLVWETYTTSEATYLWKLPNNGEPELKKQVNEIVEKIKWLRKGNKRKYLSDVNKGFTRIEHEDYTGEDMGFNKWKGKLLDFLEEKTTNKA